jgi:hypothetical protein
MKNRWTWVALVAIVFGLATPLAYADDDDGGGAVASLDAENFISQEVSEVGETGTSDVDGVCNLLGDSTFTFAITGVAQGPYPGTFTENGTLIINPLIPAMNSYEATFTIDSLAGDVIGSKSLDGFEASSVGTCTPILLPLGSPDAVDFSGTVSYDATIDAPAGSRTDSGTAFVSLFDSQVRGVPMTNGHSFNENFTSDDPGGGGDDDDDDDDGGGDDDDDD